MRETLTVDLRPLLDPLRWRASDELKELLREPLARSAHTETEKNEESERGQEKPFVAQHGGSVIDLNCWIARRSRTRFSNAAVAPNSA
jgi:hypothetical protein